MGVKKGVNLANAWFTPFIAERQGIHPINMVTLTIPDANVMKEYKIEYRDKESWHTIYEGHARENEKVLIHRFPTAKADAVRVTVNSFQGVVRICELGVYEALEK